MRGEILLGKWRPFEAEQVIGRRGFIWAAEAGRGLTKVKGFDRFAEGTGEMDWRLMGLVPVIRQSDADVTRSAAGRFASELLVLTPFNGMSEMVTWSETKDHLAVATVDTGGLRHPVTLQFTDEGRLVELSLPRWGNPNGGAFRTETFTVAFEEERRFGDHVLPASFTAGWWGHGDRRADGEFFRCTIEDAHFF